MPGVTETLETIFRMSGSEKGVAGFLSLANASQAFQEAEETAAAVTASMEGALGGVAGAAGIAAGAFAVLGAVLTGAVLKGLNEFADSQETLFRTSILFQNLGSDLPISELQDLSSEIQRLTGFDDDLIISLGGVLARFGIAGREIPDAARAIADAAAATGQSVDTLGLTFGRALLGNTRGLRNLGIEFKATGDRAADAARLVELFNERFGGAGAGRRGLVTGTFDALANSLGNFFEALGRIFAPAVVTTLNSIIGLIDQLTGMLTNLANRFPQFFPTGADIASRLDIKGDPQQTRLLTQIEENTRSDKGLVQAVLGGPGSVASRAATLRDRRVAFGV